MTRDVAPPSGSRESSAAPGRAKELLPIGAKPAEQNVGSVLPFPGALTAGTKQAPGLLVSWKEISVYLSRGVRTVQRWEQELQLPVYRTGTGNRAPVFAFKQEIDGWLRTRAGACGADSDGDGELKVVPLNPRQQLLIHSVRELSHNAAKLEQEIVADVFGPTAEVIGDLERLRKLADAVGTVQNITDHLLTVQELMHSTLAESQVPPIRFSPEANPSGRSDARQVRTS